MISTTPYLQIILEKLQTLTPQQQQEVIDFIDFLQFKANRTEIDEVRSQLL